VARQGRGHRQQGEREGLYRPVTRDSRRRKKRNPIQGIEFVDYSDTKLLQRFLNDQGKILPRRITGKSQKYQRKMSTAIKRARHLAMLPYVTDLLK